MVPHASVHGGKRAGAGRPIGSASKITLAQGTTLAELARVHTDTALQTLVSVASKGQSEAARVAAASALLDRGYGRPPQFSTGDPAKFAAVTDAQLDNHIAQLIAETGISGGFGGAEAEARH